MTQRAARSPAVVATAWPVGRPSGRVVARSSRHASRIAGPPARWIAPSTPPPPSSELFAALTIASTSCFVRSPRTISRSDIRRIVADAAHGDLRTMRDLSDCGVRSELGPAPAAEDEAAEREAETERPDGETADRDALPPRRKPLPPAERLPLFLGQRLAAALLAQRAARPQPEV